MRALITALASALVASVAQAQPLPPKKTMAPASGVLERDLRLFETLLPGEFDNAEQYFFAEEQGVAVPPRRHATITASGPHTFTVSHFVENDLTRPVGEYQAVASMDANGSGLKLSSPGCDIRWTRRANQFSGVSAAGSCGAKAETRFILSAGDLWLGDDLRLQRAHQWTCWMATPRDGKPTESFFAPGLKIWDQGGEVWIKTDDPTPREIGYRLRQVDWPAGTNQNA
ncbi:hypothetical protein, partial [Phenylobacterium sp.]|uniref:hypothetical protein n=1 Tax=Phenylobacterium sp. TaxID=1871053 RepID=UPI0037C5F97B